MSARPTGTPTPRPRRLAALCLLAGVFAGAPAGAVTISLHETPAGTVVPFFGLVAGPAPKGASGGGSLTRVMRSAERSWEAAIVDPAHRTVHYGWGRLESGILGAATVRGNQASIMFNNTFRTWFVDPTPGALEEFRATVKEHTRIDGRRMSIARYNLAKSGGPAAGRYDLLTAARHEMGHALGALFHLDLYDGALLAPTLDAGLRKHITTLDAYAVADFAGYAGHRTYNLLAPVPLPAALPLAATGVGGLGLLAASRRRRSRAGPASG